MKKTFFLTMLMMSFLVILAPSAFADDGDDGDEGDVINIEYIGYGQSHSRSQIEVPIHASYYSSLSVVGIAFIEDLGMVSIRLTNLSAGSSSTFVVDSFYGSCILPVTGGSGPYKIEFTIGDGSSFVGFFSVI